MLNKKNFRKIKKGFTLLETLVAVCIFSLVVTMLTGSFAKILRNNFSQRINQKNLADAQTTLNLLEKTIRTSIAYDDGSQPFFEDFPAGRVWAFEFNKNRPLRLFDNSQGKCVEYVFNKAGRKIQMASKPGSNINDCGDFSWANGGTLIDFTGNNIDDVYGWGWSPASGIAGRITIAISIKDQNQAVAMPLEMTASLRNGL